MSFGGGSFGSSPFGSGGLFNLVSATAVTFTTVDLVFDADLDFTNPLTLDPGSYSIDNGLAVITVSKIADNIVRLVTSEQTTGDTYIVTAIGLLGASGEVLDVSDATFTGVSTAEAYQITDLDARTHCMGRRIDLSWTNPTAPPPQWVKILRRQKNWVFDLEDAHDLVYDGLPIDSFYDTGLVVPFLSLTGPIAVGDILINVASTTGLVVGDSIRVDRILNGIPQYEVLSVLGLTATTITTSPAQYAYAVGETQLGKSSALQPQTYYYYTVLISDQINPTAANDYLLSQLFTFDDNNHVQALSISEMDSKELFFWSNTPSVMREMDTDEAAGFLDKWYSIMGCWLNIQRGVAKAALLMADVDKAPYTSLSAKSISLGTQPEGFTYDYEIPRRMVSSLSNVYKRRGACEGIIRAVRMFTKWDAVCAEFNLGNCNSGVSPFGTWDGQSLTTFDESVTDAIIVAGEITIPGAAWATSLWRSGLIIGPIGDIACVDDNDDESLFLTDVTQLTTVIAATAGNNYFDVESVNLLQPGLSLQITDSTNPLIAEIVEIEVINLAGVDPRIYVSRNLSNSYPAGSIVSVSKNLIRSELLIAGTWATTAANQQTFTPSSNPSLQRWVQNQWVGHQVLTADNLKCAVLENDGNTITVSNATLPTNGDISIARDFTVGASFALRTVHLYYRLYNGSHSFLYEPRMDLQTRGTIYDPSYRLSMGYGAPLLGAWGSADVGIYITTEVTQLLGRSPSVAANVLTLDTSQPAPGVNELAGMFLNPNQNQNQLVRIVSNTTTTITVDTDISSLHVSGQFYFVLKPRDANRYLRLVSRLVGPEREFANLDIDVRVLFGY
jgi:hypothetical protein